MYLKSLHIKNFRCFADYTIEFAPGVTVLFGKNGSGKTTLIHAIHKALSFAFKHDKTKESLNLGAGFPDLKPRNYKKSEDIVRDSHTGLPYPFISICANAQFHGHFLNWEMLASTSTFKIQYSKFSEAYKTLSDVIKDTNELPLFAYFSDSFPHVADKKKKLTQTEMSLRNSGYLGWDEETAYSNIWIGRFSTIWEGWDRANRNIQHEEAALRNCEVFKAKGIVNEEQYKQDVDLHSVRLANAKKEKARYNSEVNAIRECLTKFSQGDSNYEITDIFLSIYEENGLCIETRDGRNPSFLHLPAGYQRIYYMVLDIAYRSFILSGGKSTDMPGIVIIDEVDLHLHPELEQVVLQRLMKTFPSVQFIVSTHSPLVLSGIETEGKPNRILRMVPNTTEPDLLHDIYGLDVNSSIEDAMGVSSKNEDLDEKISLCAYMRSRGKDMQADNIKQRIIEQFSKNSEELEKLISLKMKEL